MQVGLMLEGQNGLNWENWARIVTFADDAGFDSVFRSDHFTNADGPIKDALELWTSLTYAASHTTNIDFGPLVTPITFRHPALTVQYAAALDVLSGGRLVLGMGTGWQDREHQMFGLHFPPLKERYERLQDGLEIVTRLLNGDGPVTYAGTHYSLDEAQITMRREQDTKILIGGNGPNKTLPLAAKYAVEWNGVFINREDYKERNTLLDGYLADEGRQPADVKRSIMTRIVFAADQAALDQKLGGMSSSKEDLIGRGIVVGTAAEVVEQLGLWSEAGAERIMLQWIELEDQAGLDALATQVLPQVES